MRIEDLRKRIDELDRQLVSLLNERAACARAIGELKKDQDLHSFAPAREQQVLRAAVAASAGPLPPESIEAIYREIITACRDLEHPITVAYWGPPASNTLSRMPAIKKTSPGLSRKKSGAYKNMTLKLFQPASQGESQPDRL